MGESRRSRVERRGSKVGYAAAGEVHSACRLWQVSPVAARSLRARRAVVGCRDRYRLRFSTIGLRLSTDGWILQAGVVVLVPALPGWAIGGWRSRYRYRLVAFTAPNGGTTAVVDRDLNGKRIMPRSMTMQVNSMDVGWVGPPVPGGRIDPDSAGARDEPSIAVHQWRADLCVGLRRSLGAGGVSTDGRLKMGREAMGYGRGAKVEGRRSRVERRGSGTRPPGKSTAPVDCGRFRL
jgi:hypothetical protein